ncbi:MAG TPA: acetyl-CoA carboxylase biotin carboxyl carrier protein subunit [Dehalococcoidia bacterium]|nr:acetyl-CoA carboxylase biotin carboxyl carrier protein subunit [Dehalococcoidia bacterium]
MNVDGVWRLVRLQPIPGSPNYVLVLEDRLLEVLVSEGPNAIAVQVGGHSYTVETTRRRLRSRPDEPDQFVEGRWLLRAPLTGVVSEVRAAAGDRVAAGDVLVVVEAMKMLNDLRSRVDGVVSSVHVQETQRVEIGDPLVEVREEVESSSPRP